MKKSIRLPKWWGDLQITKKHAKFQPSAYALTQYHEALPSLPHIESTANSIARAVCTERSKLRREAMDARLRKKIQRIQTSFFGVYPKTQEGQRRAREDWNRKVLSRAGELAPVFNVEIKKKALKKLKL